MNQSDTISDLKKKSFIIQSIFLPFPLLAGLAFYSIKHPGQYFLLPFMANTNNAYAGAAIAIFGCLAELYLLIPIFKAINEKQKS